MTSQVAQRKNGNGKGAKALESDTEHVPMPSDRDAERAVLSAGLLDNRILDLIISKLRPEQFYFDCHRRILEAALSMRRQGRVVDVVTLFSYLREIGRDQQVGSSAYLAELTDSVPFVANVDEYIEIILLKWRQRLLASAGQMLTGIGKTGSVQNPLEAFRTQYEQFERVVSPVDDSLGFWGDHESVGALIEEPPQQPWLLCDAETGNPVMPLGRVNLLGAGGGTGKTTVQVQLAVGIGAIAAGVLEAKQVDWCGFRIQRGGCTALFCGESDLALMRRQLWRALNHYGIEGAARAEVLRQILLVPLAGKVVSLVRRLPSGESERTDLYHRIVRWLRRLAEDLQIDWSLLVFDPISRFGGADCEKDPTAATAFVQTLESFTQLPGTPTVTATTHSSKQSLVDRRPDIRGSTATHDAARFVAVMQRLRLNGVNGILMSNVKNNEAPHFEDRWLVQQMGRAIGGMVRLATENEAVMFADELESLRRKGKPAKVAKPKAVDPDLTPRDLVRNSILAKLKERGGTAPSRSWLRQTLKGPNGKGFDNNVIQQCFVALEDEGLICIDAGPKPIVRLVEQTSQTELNLNGCLENQQTAGADNE